MKCHDTYNAMVSALVVEGRLNDHEILDGIEASPLVLCRGSDCPKWNPMRLPSGKVDHGVGNCIDNPNAPEWPDNLRELEEFMSKETS